MKILITIAGFLSLQVFAMSIDDEKAALLTYNLTPPRLGDEYVKEQVTCIRPGRVGLFKIGAEIANNQLRVHSYGHTGAGWTFLFGSRNRAIGLFQELLKSHPEYHNQAVRVIGAGANGLLMAITLKQMGFSVKIIAKDIDNLTSHKGAGIFAPGPMELNPDEKQLMEEILLDSMKAWEKIASGEDPNFDETCAQNMPLLVGKDSQSGLESLKPHMPVRISFGNGMVHTMRMTMSMFMDTGKMMTRLHQKISDLGIVIQQGVVRNFDEIPEPIIFDCAGLGSGELNNDDLVMPVQGHLLTLQNQPEEALTYMIYAKIPNPENPVDDFGNPVEEYVYITPKNGGTLGGTYIIGERRSNTNQTQFERMLKRAREFFGNAN